MWRTGWAQRWHFQLIYMLWVTILPALKFSQHHVDSDQNYSCTLGIIHWHHQNQSLTEWPKAHDWLYYTHYFYPNSIFIPAASHVKLVLAVILHLFELTFRHKDCLLINHLDKHRLWLTWKIQCTHSSLVLAFEQWQTFQGLGVPNMDSSISSNLNQKVNWNLCPQKFKAHQ